MVSLSRISLPDDVAAPTCDLIETYNASYQAGRYGEAFHTACLLIARNPHHEYHVKRAAAAAGEIEITECIPLFKNAITASLRGHSIDHQAFFRPWLFFLSFDPTYAPLIPLMDAESDEAFDAAIDWPDVRACFQDEFFLLGLKHLIIHDTVVEMMMMRIRRWALFHPEQLDEDDLPFLCAMGEYVFQHEYALPAQADEMSRAGTLNGDDDISLVLISSYVPLHRVLSEPPEHPNPDINRLLTLQVRNHRAEQILKQRLPRLTPIDDAVSQKVAGMYEDNPYPRWRQIDSAPTMEMSPQADILIAGCGTGRFTQEISLVFPACRVSAVDLSTSSLVYGWRRAREAGAEHIRFAQADILNLDSINEQFDLIESSGVLHHMKDPKAGWAALTRRLKPGGRMFIALYSEIGRQAIITSRQHIEAQRIPDTPDGIRAFRRHVMSLPYDHPLRDITERRDFFSLSECRDLVFHIQETRYTLPELKDIMNDLGLSFLGFREQKKNIQQNYAEMFPDDIGMANLDHWHVFEQKNPDTFARMYQFVCCRKGEEAFPSEGFASIQAARYFSWGRGI
jgi:SAM-dependent methyltransferase